MKPTILWISEYPLYGSAFGKITFNLCKFLSRDFNTYVVSLGYFGVPFYIEGMNILAFNKSQQISFYLRRLNPDIVVILHSPVVILEFIKYLRRRKEIEYIA